jgi:serine/threonine-protein kinase
MGRSDLSGTTIAKGKYQLVRLLGEGGGGQVYVGEQTALGKRLAIKVLAPEYARNEALVRRFLREARAAARVEHENVIQILDFGATGTGTAYIGMEFLEGEDLGDLLEREGALPWPRVKTMALQICRALHMAHSKGVIHRDLKPENCYRVEHRGNADRIKVLDFGIAKIFGDERQPQQSLSNTGQVFGTPEYMSPEQAEGQKVDARSDIYAMGIILFEMVTGAVPFSSPVSFMSTLVMQVEAEPPKPSLTAPGALPEGVDELVLRALAKSPDDRFPSMKELAEALLSIEDHRESQPPQARPEVPWIEQPNAKLVVALAALCALLALGLVFSLMRT